MLWAHVFCPQIGKSHWSLLPNTLNSPVLATRRLAPPRLGHQKRSRVQQVTQEGYPLTSVQVVGSQVHCKTFFPFLSVYVCVCSRECGHVFATVCMGEGRGQKATSASSSFLSSSCEAGSRYCCVYQTSCPVACDLPGTSCPSTGVLGLHGLWGSKVSSSACTDTLPTEPSLSLSHFFGLSFVPVLVRCDIKHHDQNQLGEERVYFTSLFIVHQSGQSGVELKAGTRRQH